MKKPLIGVTGGMELYSEGLFMGSYRIHAVANYTESIIRAGGIPIIIPPTNNIDDLSNLDYLNEVIEKVDGLLLTGGNDVDPALYGEEPHPKLGKLMTQKDKMEFRLLSNALKKDIPILGICRGHQFLNAYLGGTLYQDLDLNPDFTIMHRDFSDLAMGTHTIKTVEGSLINKIIGDKHRVNSAHHQAIKDLASDLIATAYSKDGLIEATEHKDKKHIFTVQWHPEMMSHRDKKMQAIFDEFINMC